MSVSHDCDMIRGEMKNIGETVYKVCEFYVHIISHNPSAQGLLAVFPVRDKCAHCVHAALYLNICVGIIRSLPMI